MAKKCLYLSSIALTVEQFLSRSPWNSSALMCIFRSSMNSWSCKHNNVDFPGAFLETEVPWLSIVLESICRVVSLGFHLPDIPVLLAYSFPLEKYYFAILNSQSLNEGWIYHLAPDGEEASWPSQSEKRHTFHGVSKLIESIPQATHSLLCYPVRKFA